MAKRPAPAPVDAKKAAALRACEYVEDGMVVGLGTGSTAALAVARLGERVRDEGLRIRGVPTSDATLRLARQAGIAIASLDDATAVDVTIDGADEVDPQLDLIKGLGGALLREKVVASVTRRQIIIVDESKVVPRLGTRSPLPVEVVRFGAAVVERRLHALGWKPEIRVNGGEKFVTDNGNYVLDVHFPGGIPDPRDLERTINTIPGVVENGLFLGLTWKAVVGQADGKTREIGK